MKKPVMLWITSRSRSSMVSNIFIHHGIWWGETVATQNYIENNKHKSYVSYENQNVKKLLFEYKTEYWKKVHLTPVFPVDGFIQDLAKILPSDKTWMMKTGVEYFNAFKELNPYNIFIKRSPEGVAKSLANKRVNVVDEEELPEDMIKSLAQRRDKIYGEGLHAAKWRFNYMDALQQEFGGVSINTDNLINGDFSEMKEAIEYCGLTFNESNARKAIVK